MTRRFLSALVVATVLAALTAVAVPAGAAPPDLAPSATAGGTFHPVPPRILDTRNGIGAPIGARRRHVDFQALAAASRASGRSSST
jgi:hypothetical protein